MFSLFVSSLYLGLRYLILCEEALHTCMAFGLNCIKQLVYIYHFETLIDETARSIGYPSLQCHGAQFFLSL
jgi:hypothetical protein